MPVLIVSEKTSPHDGFSRKRVMRPSSSVIDDAELERIVHAPERDRCDVTRASVRVDQRGKIDVGHRIARR